MPITVNESGVLRELEKISVNEGGVLHELNTVHSNESGILHEIYGGKIISFEVLNAENLVSGYSISTSYNPGDKVSVIFSGATKDREAWAKIRIWIHPIKKGDYVTMICSYTRDNSGYYIASRHYNSNGTVAARNGYIDDGITNWSVGSNCYKVHYTASSDKSFIDIDLGYDVLTNLSFYLRRLEINGKTIFGAAFPNIFFDENYSGDDILIAASPGPVKDTSSFTYLDSSLKLRISGYARGGKYSFHPPSAPDGITAYAPAGSADLLLIDEAGPITSIVGGRGTGIDEIYFDNALSLTVGHTYRLRASVNLSTTTPVGGSITEQPCIRNVNCHID